MKLVGIDAYDRPYQDYQPCRGSCAWSPGDTVGLVHLLDFPDV